VFFSGLLAQAGVEMNSTYNGQSEKARRTDERQLL
jgi:hypothetical protein